MKALDDSFLGAEDRAGRGPYLCSGLPERPKRAKAVGPGLTWRQHVIRSGLAPAECYSETVLFGTVNTSASDDIMGPDPEIPCCTTFHPCSIQTTSDTECHRSQQEKQNAFHMSRVKSF